MVNFCSHCGARLEADSSFCGSCGARIGPAMAEASGVPPIAVAAAPRARGLSPKLVWSVLGLLSILGVSYVAASPYIALQGYQSAVERRAFSELADAFDREELKRSLAGAINGALDKLRADDAEVGIRPNNELSMLAGLVTQGLGAGLDKALSRESLIELESMVKTGAGIADVMVPPQKREEALKLYAQVTDGVTVSTGYVDLHTFGVEATKPALGSIRLLFKRHGLVGWRLANIETNDMLIYVMRRMGIGTSETALADAAIKRKNLPLAAKWLKAAAMDGSAEANLLLAIIYLEGVDGYERDVQTAIKHAQIAFDQGSYRGAALIGAIYDSGLGVQQDRNQALTWYDRSLAVGKKLAEDDEIAYLANEVRYNSTEDIVRKQNPRINTKWRSIVNSSMLDSGKGLGSIVMGATPQEVRDIIGDPSGEHSKDNSLTLTYLDPSKTRRGIVFRFGVIRVGETVNDMRLREIAYWYTSPGDETHQPKISSQLFKIHDESGYFDCPMSLGDPLKKLQGLISRKSLRSIFRTESLSLASRDKKLHVKICPNSNAIVTAVMQSDVMDWVMFIDEK